MTATLEGKGERGLTAAEVEQRVREGKVNLAPRSASPPISRILHRNLFNPINVLLFGAATLVFLVGEGLDAIFAIPLVFNLIIGIALEWRAKRRLDQLTLLVAPKVFVIRDGAEQEIVVNRLVQGDVCLVRGGDQIVADGTVLAESGLEIDESSLTGESDPVVKDAGDQVSSGSFVVAGSGTYRAERVGKDSDAAKLQAEAQGGKEPVSPLQHDIIRLLQRIAAFSLPILAAFITVSFVRSIGFKASVRDGVTATVALIPEGLLLLTSARFALGALRLAKRGLVVSRLDAVESLARVNVLCLDKTGTITENKLRVIDIAPATATGRPELEAALGRFAASMPGGNKTLEAVALAYPGERSEPRHFVPFSSARRWSGIVLDGIAGLEGLVIGAPETFGDLGPLGEMADAARRDGQRVIYVGTVDPEELSAIEPGMPPPTATMLGIVILDDSVREGAAATLAYFAQQGVTLKLISGDNPETVKAVAARAGFTTDRWTTGPELALLDGPALIEAAAANNVFGRIAPQQKRDLIEALRGDQQHVAMTGDGVNDVLALRKADLGIALQEGTAAAQAVSSLVLLEGAFEALPETVKEGRRIVQGITVVSRLFLLKTVYSILITAAVTIVALLTGDRPDYPFHPRNLTLMSTYSIGIPAFWLTLAKREPERPGRSYVNDVLRLAVPGGVIAAAVALVTFFWLRHGQAVHLPVARSATAVATGVVAMMFIPCAELAVPPGRQKRVKLAAFLAIVYSLAFPLIFALGATRKIYDVVPLSARQWGFALLAGGIGATLLFAVTWYIRGRLTEPGVEPSLE